MNDDDVARCWDANAPTWARHVRKGYDTYRDLYNNPAFFAFCGDLKGRDVLPRFVHYGNEDHRRCRG
jgi:hypothetical protein